MSLANVQSTVCNVFPCAEQGKLYYKFKVDPIGPDINSPLRTPSTLNYWTLLIISVSSKELKNFYTFRGFRGLPPHKVTKFLLHIIPAKNISGN